MKHEIWVGADGRRVEVYGSTFAVGSRYSLLGRRTCTRVRVRHGDHPNNYGGAAFGIDSWESRKDARDFLISKGYARETK